MINPLAPFEAFAHWIGSLFTKEGTATVVNAAVTAAVNAEQPTIQAAVDKAHDTIQAQVSAVLAAHPVVAALPDEHKQAVAVDMTELVKAAIVTGVKAYATAQGGPVAGAVVSAAIDAAASEASSSATPSDAPKL